MKKKPKTSTRLTLSKKVLKNLVVKSGVRAGGSLSYPHCK